MGFGASGLRLQGGACRIEVGFGVISSFGPGGRETVGVGGIGRGRFFISAAV